jgi:hypothetical protein
MGSLVESFLAKKEKGEKSNDPQKKLPRKMPLMRRKVPSACIVKNMGT